MLRNNLRLVILIIFQLLSQISPAAPINEKGKDAPKIQGELRVDILNDLSWENKYSDTDKAFLFADSALQLAISIDYTEGMSYTYRCLGALYFLVGDFGSSIKNLEYAVEYALKTGQKYQYAKAINIWGLVYREQLKYEEALTLFDEALEIFTELEDGNEITGVLHNIAFIYSEISDFPSALEIYHEVIEIEKKRNNTYGIARTTNNLGYMYLEMQNPQKAMIYFEQAILASREIGNKNFEATALNGFAISYRESGNTEKAMESIYKAIEINKELNRLIGIGNNFVNLAGLFADIHEWASADMYIDSAIVIFTKAGLIQEKYDAWIVKAKNYLEQHQFSRAKFTYVQILTFIDSADAKQTINLYQLYNGLYLAQKNLNNIADALYWHEKYVEARAELAESEKIAKIFETETRLGAKQMKRENAHLKSENELKQRVIYSQKIISVISVAFLFIFAIIIILLLQNRKKLQDANFNLAQKNQEIQKKTIELTHANATKDRFFSIIAHDLRNPFNALLGISDIIVTEARAKNNEEITDLAESLSEISKKTYDLLENLLEWSKSQRGILNIVPENVNLYEAIIRALNSAGNSLKIKDITVHTDIDKSNEVRADERMLQVILRNLIGNAIKFTNRHGKIEIDTHAQDNFVCIVVSDNGIGMDAYTVKNLFKIEKSVSFLGTENESGSGLGLILCEEFIKKQGGKIWVESEPNKGSHFSFTLPKA